MADPRWNEIYAAPPALVLPGVPRLTIPRVLAPTCAEHCAGGHHVEAQLVCEHCRGPVFHLIAHPWLHDRAMYFYTVQPIGGAIENASRTIPPCPHCGSELVRT